MSSHRRESTTLSEGLERNLIRSEILNKPEVILQRSLSVRSTISINCSFAIRMNKQLRSGTRRYSLIGKGTLGTIYELGGTALAAKLGPAEKGRDAIWRDAILTNRASEAYLNVRDALENKWTDLKVPRVPQVHEVHMDDDVHFWSRPEIVANCPTSYHVRPLYIMDRVLPLPPDTREALINRYFPQDLQEEAKENPLNDACLARPYFGRTTPPNFTPDSLWNFPLFADEMNKIRLEVDDLAREMAMGLAVVHWEACIYGDDIEFVLGTAPTERHNLPKTFHGESPRNVNRYNFSNRGTHLWMFDFDKTDIIPMDVDMDPEALVQRLVTAVTGNDPYFPTPKINQELFDIFCETYKEASGVILKRKRALGLITKAHMRLDLPGRFVQAWARHIEIDQTPDIQFEEGDDDDQGWGEDEVDSEDDDSSDDEDEDEDEEEESDDDEEDDE